MIGECIEAKVPPPIFKYNSSEFVIEFHGETDFLLEETVEKTVEKTMEKILRLVQKNPTITSQQLQNETGLTRRGVEYNLEKLQKAGIIKRQGPDKGGSWVIL